MTQTQILGVAADVTVALLFACFVCIVVADHPRVNQVGVFLGFAALAVAILTPIVVAFS